MSESDLSPGGSANHGGLNGSGVSDEHLDLSNISVKLESKIIIDIMHINEEPQHDRQYHKRLRTSFRTFNSKSAIGRSRRCDQFGSDDKFDYSVHNQETSRNLHYLHFDFKPRHDIEYFNLL